MADWIEEGAGISYGVTIREATTVMITLLKEHCKHVPQDKDAQRTYHKIYSVQADYGGIELYYLQIFILVLPFIQTREYKERKEEHILSCQGAETKKVRALETTKADLAEIDTAATAGMITVVAVAERVMDPSPEVIKVLLADETA